MNYDKEIEEGRVVRLYLDKPAADHMAEYNSLPQHGVQLFHCAAREVNVPVLLVLPTKPLEIGGYWCDKKAQGARQCLFANCADQTDVNCRPVTLVEKEPK